MRVIGNIHLVASGALGLSLTDALDCNAWMIDTGDGLVLFDTGAGLSIDAVVGEIQADGLDPNKLRHIFLTHAHADHSGGAVGLMARLPGATLHAGREAADRMASYDERRISLDRARNYGVYPPEYRWKGAMVDDIMEDGEELRVGAVVVKILQTPGHSRDHCSFLVQGDDRCSLVSGDAVFAGGKVIIQDIPDCDVSETLSSVRRLAALRFQSFLPGHGLFALNDGMRHVVRARQYADSGLVPPSLL